MHPTHVPVTMVIRPSRYEFYEEIESANNPIAYISSTLQTELEPLDNESASHVCMFIYAM